MNCHLSATISEAFAILPDTTIIPGYYPGASVIPGYHPEHISIGVIVKRVYYTNRPVWKIYFHSLLTKQVSVQLLTIVYDVY